jgi:hypothetical protein
MTDVPTSSIGARSCALPRGSAGDALPPAGDGMLSDGCRSGAQGPAQYTPVGRRARHARAAAGIGFLALAGAMAGRRLPGRVSLWPAAMVPAWFGISHLVAGVTGYRGCPELGAIPSVMLGEPVGTSCGPWERIDRWLERPSPRLRCR